MIINNHHLPEMSTEIIQPLKLAIKMRTQIVHKNDTKNKHIYETHSYINLLPIKCVSHFHEPFNVKIST